MVTREQNDLLTRTGPGTTGGDLLRRYWQPAGLVADLPPGGAPLPVDLLGEKLVLFRDEDGRPGLLGRHCPHRGADLSYGRLEDGGLRCLYHGWLWDVSGQCCEQPGEPAGSTFHQRVRHTAYPCRELGGLVLAYLGPGAPPLLPDYEPLTVADEYRFASRYRQDCNYLQGNEGNIDPAHLSFLHGQSGAGLKEVVPGSNASPFALYRQDLSPTIEIEDAEHGLRIFTVRAAGPDSSYLRVSNFVLPNVSTFPGATGRTGNGYSMHWHVPIDDTHHWKYEVSFTRSAPLDRARYAVAHGYAAEVGPDGRLRRHRENRYLQDRTEMQTSTWAGLGGFFGGHDAFATESQGAVQDRTAEHLGYTDKAIAAARRLLLDAVQAVQAGGDPPHARRAPGAGDGIGPVVISEVVPPGVDWRAHWAQKAEAIRAGHAGMAEVGAAVRA